MASSSSSCTRMSTAMALVASSRRPKRRSLSEISTPLNSLPTKRRRSARRRRRQLPPPPPPPSAALFRHQLVPAAAAAAASPPLFVKTEPLQNLATAQLLDIDDLDGEDFGDLLSVEFADHHHHRVPSFFSADDHHLLIDILACKSEDCSRSSSASISAAAAPDISKIDCSSPSISESAICCSSGSLVISGADADVNDSAYQTPPAAPPLWEDHDEASCGFLSPDFYEIETEMRSIIGEAEPVAAEAAAAAAALTHHLCEIQQQLPEDSSYQWQSRSINVKRSSCKSSSSSSSLDSGRPAGSCGFEPSTSNESNQTATSNLSLQMSEAEEEYRIDLTDFELPEISGGSELTEVQKEEEEEEGCSQRRKRRALNLNLDYEEVAKEWSDRGPVLTDGRWALPEGAVAELDLSAWEEEAAVGGGGGGGATSGGKMIRVEEGEAAAAGRGVAAEVAAAAAEQRLASLLRYREKRRTRLFAKKIRYEVRKLNAERRPRMKGRFIKRSAVE